jgi:4-amino-4-deoxy-L-arabinose transferase-like glycosyltransferase
VEWILVGLLFTGFAAAQTSYLNDPYFGDALYYVTSSARQLYLNPSQIVPDGPWDNGHPPLLFWTLAALWGLAGHHLWVSHLVILICALAALSLAWALGRSLFGPLAGFLSAILLALNPVFYYTSATINIDVPVTALTLLCLLLTLRGRWGAAAVAGSAMVLTRETSWAFLPVIAAAGVFFASREDQRLDWRGPAALVMVPALVLGVWLVVHYAEVGWWIYQDPSRTVKSAASDLVGSEFLYHFYSRSVRPFLRHHGQWAGSLLILIALGRELLRIRTRTVTRNAWMLAGIWAGLVLPLGAFSGLIETYLPRYHLAAIAIAAILAGWAASLLGRAGPLMAGMLSIILLTGHQEPWRAGWETSRDYTRVLELNRRGARYLEVNHPEARILSYWPFYQKLCDPFYGYVTRPMNVVVHHRTDEAAGFCAPGALEAIIPERTTASDVDLLLTVNGQIWSRADLHWQEVGKVETAGRSLVFYAPGKPDE